MRSILKSAERLFVGVVLMLALAVAMPLAAKKKDYLDGKIMDAKYGKTDKADDPANAGHNFLWKHFYFTVQVEDMTYVGDYKQTGGLIGVTHYKFKEEDWPVNADVEVRFKVKHVFGLRHTFMYLKRSNGKEIELDVVSKQDSNGKELCGNYRC